MTTLISERKKASKRWNSEDAISSKEIVHISEEYNSTNKNKMSGC